MKKRMKRGIESYWKELFKKLEPTGEVDSKGEISLRWKLRDPSLRDQLYERKGGEKWNAYFDALSKAPNASEDTKRKWRRALGIA